MNKKTSGNALEIHCFNVANKVDIVSYSDPMDPNRHKKNVQESFYK